MSMDLLKDLFSSDVGILSAIVIAFILCMAVYFIWLFTRNDAQPPAQQPPARKRS